MKSESHPMAGKTVILKIDPKADTPKGEMNGEEFRVEDYWHHVAGKSWMNSNGNPACMNYAIRSGLGNMPTDDEVVYGKIGAYGYLIHVSELGPEVA